MKDILRHADGTETVISDNASGTPTAPVTPLEPTKKKFSLAATTDKMGLTTAGTLTRTFFWGVVIGAGALVALGMWKDKINISYTK